MKRQWKGFWTSHSAGPLVGNIATYRQTALHSTLRSLVKASDLLKPSAWCYYAGLNSLHVGECQSMYCRGTLCRI